MQQSGDKIWPLPCLPSFVPSQSFICLGNQHHAIYTKMALLIKPLPHRGVSTQRSTFLRICPRRRDRPAGSAGTALYVYMAIRGGFARKLIQTSASGFSLEGSFQSPGRKPSVLFSWSYSFINFAKNLIFEPNRLRPLPLSTPLFPVSNFLWCQ